MEMAEDAWEQHVTPLLMNCGQDDDNNVPGGHHSEYMHHTDEVRLSSFYTHFLFFFT